MRYEMISADCHIDLIWLPPDLFTLNASAALRERMPYVVDSEKRPPLGFEKRPGFWIDERYGGSVNLSNFSALTNGKCTGKPLIDRSSSGDARINSTRNPVKLTIRFRQRLPRFPLVA